jgi:type IV pilus assembly protein PilE
MSRVIRQIADVKAGSGVAAMTNESKGFTFIELILCLAVLSILAATAVPLHLGSVEKARAVEGKAALAEVVRLEHLYFANKGSYTADLQELGFNTYGALRDTQIVARNGGSQTPTSLPASLKGGSSACSIWTGWGSMEGGRIEGEESINTSSSSTGGGSPCGGKKVVNHGKKT